MSENNKENQENSNSTEASNRFLTRRQLWRGAEVAQDIARAAILPLRLAGHMYEAHTDTEVLAGAGLVMYEVLFGLPGAVALFAGKHIVENSPHEWGVPAGIAFMVAGGLLQIPRVVIAADALIKGVVNTAQETREENKSLKAERAARRARGT
jgi:hypothetical protein